MNEHLSILGITLETNETLTYQKLRSAYLKKSLKYHPDKNNGKDEMFKKINNSYEFLLNEIETKNEFMGFNDFSNNSSNENKDENEKVSMFDNFMKAFTNNSSYNDILDEFLRRSCKNNDKIKPEFVLTTVKTVIEKCRGMSYSFFEKLDKDKCMDIYEFLVNISDSGLISTEYLQYFKEIINKKMKNSNIYIIEPDLEDLLNDKVYKLEVLNNAFYVPLWHNELYFDYINSENEQITIITKIEPVLPVNVEIDKNNNLFVRKHISKDKLKNIWDDGGFFVFFSERKIWIDSNKILLTKKSQFFRFENAGILEINTNNLFDTTNRKSIIIELIIKN